jgi:hypothetical protein
LPAFGERAERPVKLTLFAKKVDKPYMSRHVITWLALFLAAAEAWADKGPGTTPAPVPATTEAEALPLPRPAEKVEPLKPPVEKTGPEKPADSLAQALAQLKRERMELTTERTAAVKDIEADGESDGDELARLRLRLRGLVARLAAERNRNQGKPSSQGSQHTRPDGRNPKETEPEKESEPTGESRPPIKGGPNSEASGTIDPAGLAQAFFRSEDFAGALRAYRIIDQRRLKLEDRITIMYMMATCLRRTGKLSEAAALYRKVADSRGNPIMADCARWQLGAIRWRQDLEARLVDSRKERAALEVKK